MKKTLLFAAFAALFFTSCGGGTGFLDENPSLSTSEGIQELKTELLENYGGDQEIYRINLYASDHLTSEFGWSRIHFLQEGLGHSQEYNAEVLDGQEKLQEVEKDSEAFQREMFLKKKQGKIKLKDLDFNLIVSKFNEACQIIPDEFEDFTLYNWDFEIDNDNQISADFSIEATKKGEGSHMEGRNIVTDYYEFKFEMNTAGELEAKG